MSASHVLSAAIVTFASVHSIGAAPSEPDERDDDEPVILIPAECMQYRTAAETGAGDAMWTSMLSLAGCVQDASLYRVGDVELVPVMVDEMETAVAPSFRVYLGVLEHAPEHLRLRAAYALALGEVALMTRARTSLQEPALRANLEQLLDPHAQLAFVVFSAIDEVARDAPESVTDPVDREIIRSSRQHAAALRGRWPERTAEALSSAAL